MALRTIVTAAALIALATPALAGGGAAIAPVAPAAGAQPAGNPNAEGAPAINNASTILGKVRQLDVAARSLMMDNGQTYTIAANVDLANIAANQNVALTIESGNRVVKIAPAP